MAEKKGAVVLVVEDDTTVQNELRELIAREGHAVEIAESWLQAERLLSQIGRPCCVLVDALMPGADEFAYEIARRERCAVATIPVRLARNDGTIVKEPVHLEILLDCVREHCGEPIAAAN